MPETTTPFTVTGAYMERAKPTLADPAPDGSLRRVEETLKLLHQTASAIDDQLDASVSTLLGHPVPPFGTQDSQPVGPSRLDQVYDTLMLLNQRIAAMGRFVPHIRSQS